MKAFAFRTEHGWTLAFRTGDGRAPKPHIRGPMRPAGNVPAPDAVGWRRPQADDPGAIVMKQKSAAGPVERRPQLRPLNAGRDHRRISDG